MSCIENAAPARTKSTGSSEQVPRVSIVAPARDECENLDPLVRAVVAAMTGEAPFEIVLVDDGSVDGSRERLETLAWEFPQLVPLFQPEPLGQSAALLRGIATCRGRFVVTMDADLQNDPADIPHLLGKMDQADVVSGVRAHRQDRWSRRLASRLGNGLRRLVLGDRFRDIGCSLRAYRAEFLVDLPPFQGVHRYLPLFAIANGARSVEVEVGHHARRSGASKYQAFGKRMTHGLWDLLGVRWLLRRRFIGPTVARRVAAETLSEEST